MEDQMNASTNPTAQNATTNPEAGMAPGHGWVTYAGIMLIVGAVANGLWGWAALADAQEWGETYPLLDSAFVGRLEFWGWVALVWAGVLALGAALLFAGHSSGRVIGMIVAGVSIVFWLIVMPAFPLFAITVIALDALVIFGLAVHWPASD